MPVDPWGQSPWGSGQNTYGIDRSNWWFAPGTLGDVNLQNNPESAYQRYLLGQGVGGNQSPAEKWYGQQYNRQFENYNAQMATPGADTTYRFLDFLRDYGGGLQSQFASLSPGQRGQRPENWQKLRWLS